MAFTLRGRIMSMSVLISGDVWLSRRWFSRRTPPRQVICFGQSRSTLMLNGSVYFSPNTRSRMLWVISVTSSRLPRMLRIFEPVPLK